jgi:hypothetical protein
MTTGNGQPVEFFLTPGSWSDTRTLKMYQFDLPEEALITGDKACNDYGLENMMKTANFNLLPLRKKLSPAGAIWANLSSVLLSKSHRNYRQLDRTLVTQTHPCCHRSWL